MHRKKFSYLTPFWRNLFIICIILQALYGIYCTNLIDLIFYKPASKSHIPSKYFSIYPPDLLTRKSDFDIKISSSCGCQSKHDPQYSTTNDLVMTLAKKSLYNSLLFLKTFRRYCQAALVIFVDSVAYSRYKQIQCFFSMQSQCHFYLACFSDVKLTFFKKLSLLSIYVISSRCN